MASIATAVPRGSTPPVPIRRNRPVAIGRPPDSNPYPRPEPRWLRWCKPGRQSRQRPRRAPPLGRWTTPTPPCSSRTSPPVANRSAALVRLHSVLHEARPARLHTQHPGIEVLKEERRTTSGARRFAFEGRVDLSRAGRKGCQRGGCDGRGLPSVVQAVPDLDAGKIHVRDRVGRTSRVKLAKPPASNRRGSRPGRAPSYSPGPHKESATQCEPRVKSPQASSPCKGETSAWGHRVPPLQGGNSWGSQTRGSLRLAGARRRQPRALRFGPSGANTPASRT